MTTSLVSMNDSNMATGMVNGDTKVASPASNEASEPAKKDPPSSGKEEKDKTESSKGEETPNLQGEEGSELSPSETQMNAPLPSHPGTAAGYYLGYAQHNGAPPSPTVTGHAVTGLPYGDATIGSFMQQPGTFAAAHTSPFGVPNSNTPLSPPRATVTTAGMVGVPPASPLFPRINNGGIEGSLQQQVVVPPQSPNLPYLGSYAATARSQTGGSSEEASWDRYV